MSGDYWVIRPCRGKIRRKWLGLVSYTAEVFDESLFGAWFCGPWSLELAKAFGDHRSDRVVRSAGLAPELLAVLTETRAPGSGSTRYLSSEELADPAGLLKRLRGIIWTEYENG